MIKPSLIERWLPTADLGIDSTGERTPTTPFPAPNRVHVRWNRRPLVTAFRDASANHGYRHRACATRGRAAVRIHSMAIGGMTYLFERYNF